MEAGPPLSLGMDTPRQRPGGQTHVQGAPRVLLFWNMFPPPVAMWAEVLAVRFLQSGLSLNDFLGGSVLDVTFAQSGMPTLSPCHCGQLRAGQRGHRKGRRWCGPAGGWTVGATGRAWELGAGEDPVRRAQGSEQRWRGAWESARSPCGCWMSATGEGRLRASVSHLCLGWGRKAPGDWGSWPRTTRPGVCRSGCGLPGALGPRLWRETPLPLASQESTLGWGGGRGSWNWALCPLSWAGGRSRGPEGAVRTWKAPGDQGLDLRSPQDPSSLLHPWANAHPSGAAPQLGSPSFLCQLRPPEAPAGVCMCVCVCVCVCVRACTRVCMGAIHDGSGVCMCR